MALLASTTLGVEGADTVHAVVRLDEGLREDGSYRLIVQSYDARGGRLGARPVGSVQRAVTASELRKGVKVNVLELRESARGAGDAEPVVVAWVERGAPDLEFDGRRARPRPGSPFGMVRRATRNHPVEIALSRAPSPKLAA
jgi:hypothetical protein